MDLSLDGKVALITGPAGKGSSLLLTLYWDQGAKFVNMLFNLSVCANPIFHPFDNAADRAALFYLKLRT